MNRVEQMNIQAFTLFNRSIHPTMMLKLGHLAVTTAEQHWKIAVTIQNIRHPKSTVFIKNQVNQLAIEHEHLKGICSMLTKLFVAIAIITFTATHANSQGISKKVLERAKVLRDPQCDVQELNACYDFKAIVQIKDMDSSLNVWSIEPIDKYRVKGGKVIDQIRDGEIFYVNWVFDYKGRKMAFGYYIKPGCEYHPAATESCGRKGSVDLRYLR
jgi:hypothetical protein